ncbi:GMP synthase (glutamine-hydrolysing) [Sediminihabitans luteus]|uniref:GMP synthase (Glutamine-hydrolysing) n=1 Tax=Sediminihabitans luteus TaxID=1138585 RepID=A0A2M9CEL7_9CELL|nr:glutamine amidotransferase [Sediminihabitans luteus]PJJ70329.1 GMP synthase (glutamine-hydrolysing) [Sediminihabitans luteus]GII97800.1 glutamine amidotransferase [Sediminihabitans luteus]
MKPFLLLASRPEDDAADAESAAFARFGGLAPRDLHRVRMEAGPLPALDLDDYSGVLLGGSPFTSSDPEDDKSEVQRRVEKDLAPLLDEIVDRDLPFLGACYGVGTLGLHEGAVIDETYGEDVGPVTIEVTDAGRDDPLLAGLPPTFQAYVGHKEACRTLPAHAVLLATSATCPVQMFRVRENLYATQFHPELDLQGITQRIEVYREHGYFPPDEADAVIAHAGTQDVTVPSRILAAFVRRYARA